MRKILYLMGIMNDGDIDWMSQIGEMQHVKAGSALIQKGVTTEWIHIVLEGRFAVMLDEKIEVAKLGQGEVFGELSFLDSRPPSASVIALEDSNLLALHRDVVTQRLNDDPRFAARFYRSLGTFLADRLRSTSGQLGYLQKDVGRSLQATEDDPADELDDTWTESIAFAASRFDNLLRALQIA